MEGLNFLEGQTKIKCLQGPWNNLPQQFFSKEILLNKLVAKSDIFKCCEST